MATAKIFQNGSSQAVRLPKEFRVQGKEVKISKQGNKIILEPIENSWTQWFESMTQFSDDFMESGREQFEPPQERDWSLFE
nr:type II toxin-antitoxin system VapB family antitoxin [Crenothrix polyspora]